MTATREGRPMGAATQTPPGLSSGYRMARAEQLKQLRQRKAADTGDRPFEDDNLAPSDSLSSDHLADLSTDSEPASLEETAPPGRSTSLLRRLLARRPSARSAPAEMITSAGDASFEIPLPGRRTNIGRFRSWVTRLGLVIAPLVLIGGVAYSCGVSTGSARLVQPATISADDASAFHLSSYPADRAAAFGVSYLSLCWTHPDAANTTATADRVAALARMTSAGVTPGCGWTGSTPSAAPLAVTWDGSIRPIQAAYADGAAAQLGFVVTTADGRTVGAALPIWVSSTTTAAGVRVVGDVAVVPIAPAAAAPTPAAPQLTDSAIAESLTRNVLVPFLRAWAVSDPVQLNLVLARDASTAARAGMEGQVSAPSVSRTQVVVTRGDPKGYRDGDLVTVQVGVDWTTRLGGMQRAGYSISLRLTAGRWQVTDITGAAPDPVGGAAPATTFATTATASPTAG